MSSVREAVHRGRPLTGLLKHSAVYSAAPVLRQLISIGMHRLYTGWLGTAGMGVKETVDVWLIGGQQILGQNALGGMMRFYFDHKREEDRAKVVTSCTILVGIFAWLVCGTALWFGDDLRPLMFRGREIGPTELGQVLRLTLLLIPFQLSTLAGFYYLMILKRSGLFTTIQTTKLVFEVALNFVLIGAMGLGVRGFLLSMLAGEALTSLLLTGWILVSLRPRVDLRIMRPILVYAAPLIPVGLCQMALNQIDRILLGYFGDEAVSQTITGIYGHGYKISLLVHAMMLSPFMQVWLPWIFGVEDARERARLVARVSTYCVLTIGAASLGLILFGRQAAVILAKDPRFWEAYKIIPLCAAGYVLWGLYKVSELPLLIAKRTGRLFLINLLAVVVNVWGNKLLIPRYGFVGAGIMTLVTFGALAGMGMLASRSEARVPFEGRRLVSIVLCVFAAGALALWIDSLDARGALSTATALAAKVGALGVLACVLWTLVLERDERRGLVAWLAGRLGRGGGPPAGDGGR